MQRKKAERVVRKALGLRAKEAIAELSVRQVLWRKHGRQPRHGELFALLAQIQKELGYGGITVELAEGLVSVEDIVHYLEGIPEPED